MFCDASQNTNGVLVFIALQSPVLFVTAKIHVTSLNKLRLPCLELMAALIATRLTLFCTVGYSIP